MKRIVSTLLLLVLLASSSFAQRRQAVNLSLSFNPTLNWLSIGGKDAQSTSVGFGYDYGLNADFFLDKYGRYALASGLIISNLKSSVNYNPDHDFSIGSASYSANTPVGVDYKLSYIEIPLAFRLRTKQFNRSTFWGQFGVFTAWNFNAEASTDDGTLHRNDINKDISLYNMGLDLGIGCEYDLGEHNALSFGLIYKGGFFDIMTNNLGDKTTTKSLALQVSFIF
ncbi:MAG: porin family protein [Mangrovibacterium sp.]